MVKVHFCKGSKKDLVEIDDMILLDILENMLQLKKIELIIIFEKRDD